MFDKLQAALIFIGGTLVGPSFQLPLTMQFTQNFFALFCVISCDFVDRQGQLIHETTRNNTKPEKTTKQKASDQDN